VAYRNETLLEELAVIFGTKPTVTSTLASTSTGTNVKPPST